MKVNKLIPLGAAMLVLIPLIFSPSCANTTQAPTGGAKDTIPPVIVDIKPLPGTVNVPLKDTKIVFRFNEYVTIKNAQSIFLSPPQSKRPKSRISQKNLIVYFEDDLEPNTTYTLDLNDAIADNNEGNMYAGFTYVFSTGNSIDSLYLTGTVKDCSTMKPVKSATVLLYKDHSDSAIFKKRPYAAAKTDEWGFFSMPYLQDTSYRLYALKDDAGNNIYDPDVDQIAFVDSLVTPKYKVNDTIYELFKFNMKDTLECQRRKSEYTLNLFRERPTKQYLFDKKRLDDRYAYVSFNAPNAWIDSLWIAGYDNSKIITSFNILQDSLLIWINDRKTVPDTLHLFVNYRKTDSLGRYVPTVEHCRLALEDLMKRKHRSRRDIKHDDTTCVFKINAEGSTFEKKGFYFEFKYPLINESFDALSLISVNPKQKESAMKYTIESDSLDIRCYTLWPSGKILPGYEYKLKVPHRAFRDINGFWSDSTEVKVSLPSDDELSTLYIDFKDVDRKIIVDILTEKMDKVIFSSIIENNQTLTFPYLKEGNYVIRVTDDGNRNSIVDPGSLLEHRQPEKVMLYSIGGKDYISIMKSSEVKQTVSLKKLLED